MVPPTVESAALKVTTVNVRGLNNKIKLRRITTALIKQHPDVLMLQETHLKDCKGPLLKSKYFGQQFHSPGSSKARGTAILLSSKVRFQLKDVKCDDRGRYVFVKGVLEHRMCTLASIYAPNQDQIRFLQDTLVELHNFTEGDVIIGGDLNYLVDMTLDRLNRRRRFNRSVHNRQGDHHAYTRLYSLLQKYNLIDIWRWHHPKSNNFTYYSAKYDTHTRIDYILISKSLLQEAPSSDIGYKIWTDHAWVECQIKWATLAAKPRTWRLDTQLLKDQTTVEKLRQEIEAFIQVNDNGEVSQVCFWEAMKATMRGRLIAATAYKRKEQQKVKNLLLHNIKTLENRHKLYGGKKVFRRLQAERRALDILETSRIKRNLFYLRQQYWIKTPKALRTLAWRVRQKVSDRMILALRDKDNSIQVESPKIAQAMANYYTDLYASRDPSRQDIEGFFNEQQGLPRISDDHKDGLDAEITAEEVLNVIKKLKTKKTPGEDGFPSEYYKAFSEVLVDPMVKLFNHILESGEIPPSWREAIIVPIGKKEGDHTNPSAYRPIALQNQDAKIFTSLLADRLKNIIGEYVHVDQTGFIPSRDIADNIRRAIDIIQHCQKQKVADTLLLAIDMQKAFDSIEVPYLMTLLRKMNLGDGFCRIIHSLYASPRAKVKVNGGYSQSFALHRGTRQGCPLSPLLFALCVEPLAHWIRSHPSYSGIQVGKSEHRISLFADDILLFMSNPMRSLKTTQDILMRFGQVSGLRINVQKTEIYPIQLGNATEQSLRREYKFKWVQEAMRYLGIWIPVNISLLKKFNYTKNHQDLKKLIKSWDHLTLTWADRLSIIKAILLPKFIFLFRTLPLKLSLKELKEWQRLLLDFLWEKKRHRISFTTLRKSKDKGGLQVPDLELYFAAANLVPVVRTLNRQLVVHWKGIENWQVKPYDIEEILWSTDKKVLAQDWGLEALTTMLHVWCKWKNRLVGKCSPFAVFTRQKWFPPGAEGSYHAWKESGKNRLNDIFPGGKGGDKSRLEDICGFPIPWFQYFQLRQLGDAKLVRQSFQRPLGGFESLLSQKGTSLKGLLSKIYKLLLCLEMKPAIKLQRRWEIDCKREIPIQEWDGIFLSPMFTTKILAIRYQSLKLIHRWYTTPVQIHYVQDHTSSFCWHNCGAIGNYIHCWWECPRVSTFWDKIVLQIRDISGVCIPKTPEFILLSYWIDKPIVGLLKHTISILLAAARLEIASKWKGSSKPSLSAWRNRLWDHYFMFKIIDLGKKDDTPLAEREGVKIWKPILQYLQLKGTIPQNFLDMGFKVG